MTNFYQIINGKSGISQNIRREISLRRLDYIENTKGDTPKLGQLIALR